MSSDSPPNLSELSPSNLGWVEELYYAYRRDPASVDEAWRREFDRLDGVQGGSSPTSPAPVTNGHGNGHAVAGASGTNGHPVTVEYPVPALREIPGGVPA